MATRLGCVSIQGANGRCVRIHLSLVVLAMAVLATPAVSVFAFDEDRIREFIDRYEKENAEPKAPDADFIYRVIGESQVDIIDRVMTEDQCYRVVTKTGQYAFLLVPDYGLGSWTWLAMGGECGERNSDGMAPTGFWNIPDDEPSPEFVFRTIGESIASIGPVNYVPAINRYSVRVDVHQRRCVVLLGKSGDAAPNFWAVSSIECDERIEQ